MSSNNVVLLLGSNINNPEANIQEALRFLSTEVGEIIKISQFLKTKPVGFVSINNFCNIAIRIKTRLSPITLLEKIKQIERKMGRIKDSSELGGYQDRIIDIDIVLFNEIKYLSHKLQIPHIRNLYERDFAIKLINEVR